MIVLVRRSRIQIQRSDRRQARRPGGVLIGSSAQLNREKAFHRSADGFCYWRPVGGGIYDAGVANLHCRLRQAPAAPSLILVVVARRSRPATTHDRRYSPLAKSNSFFLPSCSSMESLDKPSRAA